MAKDTTFHVIRGKAHWAKVLGAPLLNTFSGVREHSIDITPDEAGLAEIKRIGAPKLRDPGPKDTRTAQFVTFRHKETREDRQSGEIVKNDPIKIVDAAGTPWPQDKLIGNESTVDLKFSVKAYGPGKPKGVYVKAIRVLELNEYVRQEFAPLSEDDQFFATGSTATPATESTVTEGDADLDDDVPF